MNNREKLCARLFEWSKAPYQRLFKKEKIAWNLSSNELIEFPQNSLGQQLGLFLQQNGFELIDKLESHDVYHVITGMSTEVKDEIGMQFLLFGNGKRSVYLFATMSIGAMLTPEHFKHYMRCYKKGKGLYPIENLQLYQELKNNLPDIQNRIRKPSNVKLYNHLDSFI